MAQISLHIDDEVKRSEEIHTESRESCSTMANRNYGLAEYKFFVVFVGTSR